VLGGGIRPAVPAWEPAPDLQASADRLWHSARLYRQELAPKVIISGSDILGQYSGVPTATTEAGAMTQFLTDLGVPPSAIVSEARSLNTRDNIQLVRAMVQDKPVALVTSAYHMARAMRLAERYKLNAMAFPTDWEQSWATRPIWHNWLPTGEAQAVSATAI
jgi:uncharacterized SAM-binding protein YcdF (DUF218 family)